MKLYFPAVDFLGRVEMTQDGKLEEKYDKDQLFFNILNNPGYVNNRLCSNFNNKLSRFFDTFPYLKNFIHNQRVCFYEYSTFSYKEPASHKEINHGSFSWTLAYYIASLAAVFDAAGFRKKKWEHVVLAGDIGSFTGWDQLSESDKLKEQLISTIREFLFHPKLKITREILWVSSKAIIKDLNSLKDSLADLDFEIKNLGPGRILIHFKEHDFSLTLLEVCSTAEILDELFLREWRDKPKTRRKYFLYAALFLVILTVGFSFILGKLPFIPTGFNLQPAKNQYNWTLYPVFMIKKKSSLTDTPNPDGFLQFGLMIGKDQYFLLKDSLDISNIEVVGPDGKTRWEITPHQPFHFEKGNYWTGFFLVQKNELAYLWVGLDFSYHTKYFPPYGRYTYVITDVSGGTHIVSSVLNENNKKDPIEGYPTQVRYNSKTRKVSWKGTRGQSGYAVGIFQGEKKGRENWEDMIYYSKYEGFLIKDNFFILPEKIKLEKGKDYYILIDSVFSSDINFNAAPQFIHTQDRSGEIAVFKAE